MAIKRRPDETVDSMLRRFKREVTKSGVLIDLRKKEYYIPPSEKRRLKSAEAQKRERKRQAKQRVF